jgi:hypothetical protein
MKGMKRVLLAVWVVVGLVAAAVIAGDDEIGRAHV